MSSSTEINRIRGNPAARTSSPTMPSSTAKTKMPVMKMMLAMMRAGMVCSDVTSVPGALNRMRYTLKKAEALKVVGEKGKGK